MLYLEGFYGKALSIPEDRLYIPGKEFWAQGRDDGALYLGITEAGVILMGGGLSSIEYLVQPEEEVAKGSYLAFSQTFKGIRYLEMPVNGWVKTVNAEVATNPGIVAGTPYDVWMIAIEPTGSWRSEMMDASAYRTKLADSEHVKGFSHISPQVAGGKGSPTCRSVYSGLKEKK